MTPDQLAEIEARAKAASEMTSVAGYVGLAVQLTRQDIPDLIAHIREMEEEIDALKESAEWDQMAIEKGGREYL